MMCFGGRRGDSPRRVFAYRYDAVGRIVSRAHDLGTNRFDRTYAYDDMDRLASDGDAAYSYDAAELRAVRYRFQGRERSAATGLANFRMRWYDAVTGRWLSKDPIGLSGGLNLYAFCECNPNNCRDFFGDAVLATRGLKHSPKITKYTPWLLGPIGPLVTEATNTGVYHQHIFYEDEKGGNIGYSDKGCFSESSDDGYDCSPWHYDDVMRKAVAELLNSGDWGPNDYKLMTHNCQDFCDAAVKKYNELNGPKRKWRTKK